MRASSHDTTSACDIRPQGRGKKAALVALAAAAWIAGCGGGGGDTQGPTGTGGSAGDGGGDLFGGEGGGTNVSVPPDADFVQADISKSADVQRLVRATVERHGRLDAAFNNAGIGEASPKFADVSEDEYDRHFDINARGTFLCMKYELRQMLAQGGGGAIINNASVQSHIAIGTSAHYTASKHAILGYTRAAAVDHATDNIRVNAISPGIVMTPMMEGFDPKAPEVAMLMARIPAGRVATPEEIAGVVAFMASDRAAYMFGASIAVDGGWLAH